MGVAENRRHRTDAELVAFLDGEMDPAARRSVSDHLDLCWHCRTRASAFQTSMEHVTRVAQERSRRVSADPVLAERFFRRLDRQMSAPGSPVPRALRMHVYAVAAATALLVVIVAVGLESLLSPSPLASTAIRQQMEDLEEREAAPGAIRHQVYELDLEGTKPTLVKVRHRVEIWSDGSRQSIRLEGEEGALRYAAWRTQDRFLAERGHLAGNSPACSRLGECLTAEEAEAFAARLLRRQPSGRLRLAAGLFRDLERSGFTLEHEAVREGERIRLVARQKRGAFEDRAWLEVDPVRQIPVALGLFSETSSAAWKLVLSLEKEEEPPPALVPASAFIPEPLPVPARIGPPEPRRTEEENLDERELGVLAFTSRWRKPGERFRADRVSGQGIFLGGTVSSDERKNEIVRLLDAWPGLGFSVHSANSTAGVSGWCRLATEQLHEAGEYAWVMRRLQTQYARMDLAPELRTLRDRLTSEQTAGFIVAVEELDRLLRPIRGSSAQASFVVVKDAEDALGQLSSLIRNGCEAADGDTIPAFETEARGQMLGLIVTLKDFRWAIGMPDDPANRGENQED